MDRTWWMPAPGCSDRQNPAGAEAVSLQEISILTQAEARWTAERKAAILLMETHQVPRGRDPGGVEGAVRP